jgi:hypothetical protein
MVPMAGAHGGLLLVSPQQLFPSGDKDLHTLWAAVFRRPFFLAAYLFDTAQTGPDRRQSPTDRKAIQSGIQARPIRIYVPSISDITRRQHLRAA